MRLFTGVKGSDKMFTFGVIAFIISGLIVFGADFLFKKGTIKTVKGLLITKTSGLLIAVVAALLMFYG